MILIIFQVKDDYYIAYLLKYDFDYISSKGRLLHCLLTKSMILIIFQVKDDYYIAYLLKYDFDYISSEGRLLHCLLTKV